MCCCLLLGNLHGRLGLRFSHEALLNPARIDGQADDLLVELTTRSGDVLPKILQLYFDQIFRLTVELLHIVDIVLVDTLVELRTTGNLMHDMIENL